MLTFINLAYEISNHLQSKERQISSQNKPIEARPLCTEIVDIWDKEVIGNM